ncbi:MAG: protein kinase [Acidobacteria bacterium]|nr:protein kinase [Acidobacteriota bacterium]NIM61235.1 protein kinase [Acidobacteriota bacterium]NIO59613.1 protein kinase [Acidobacteriota bacterium]NIQ30706.1 protein kinase [Acidobacteriota bacterium]NIQ85679.1 protein kinase [Acidobacteriota bacterium]
MSKVIDSFNFTIGRVLAGKYRIERLLGRGWEGEAYQVTEVKTGVQRAAKVFYPQRNRGDRALRAYARKLEKLSGCSALIRYHHTDSFRRSGQPISFVLSELVRGEILEDFVKRQRGGRLTGFEALHLLRAVARGVAQIHQFGEYHGDLHDRNVLVRRRGIHFEVKLLDLSSDKSSTRHRQQDDVIDLAGLLYGMVGGRKWYARQPPEIKTICRGMKHSLILDRFHTSSDLVVHLDGFGWDTPR